MARIDMMFYEDGRGNLAPGDSTTLESDQRIIKEAGGEERVVAHVVLVPDNEVSASAIDGLLTITHLEICGLSGAEYDTALERLGSKIFQAGMEYQKTLQR